MKLLRMAMEIQDWDGPAGGQDDVDETVNVRFVEDTQIGIDCECYLGWEFKGRKLIDLFG